MQAVTLAVALGGISFSVQAQFRVPQPERKTPRAIGVLETYKNGSSRLIPVTFFYEKKYYDAALYHATPVPFTLYSETVYEVQQFGKALGMFTVQTATRHETTWWGNGKLKGLPNPALMAKKAEAPVVVEDPSRPVLHRREGSQGDAPPVHPSAAPSSGGQPEAPEDPDRPKLHRKEGSGGDASAQSSAPGNAGQASPSPSGAQAQTTAQTQDSSQEDPDRPKLHRKDDSPADKSAGGGPAAASKNTTVATVGAPELTPSSDPDHPILRRGKPIQEQSGRDLPEFKLEEPVTRQVAVSDAGSSQEPSPLIYTCPPEERARLEKQAYEMALDELRRMRVQRGIPMPEPKTPARGVKSAAAQARAMADWKAATAWPATEEQFVPYDLEYNNYATVVYSARFTAPVDPKSLGKPKSWVVTVIAREDEDKLVKLYSAVSDPRELGLYPEVRLVDAVDPEGYGHYRLLFREKKRDGVSWLLGRVTGYELQKMFETAEH